MKTILIYSGGLDSTILLHKLKKEGGEIKCISFNYGQRHSKELVSATFFCKKLGIEHKITDLQCIKSIISNSCLTSESSVPEGHYAEDSMKLTVVPNRNMIMISLAIGWAINEKFDSVTYAAHSGDHAIYPDCREEFVSFLSKAAELADWHPVKINRPFIHLTKGDIVKLGEELSVEFEKTWSCYNGREKHCGKCGTCAERKEAFSLAGVQDLTTYE